jgi:phage gp46-like protein
MPTDVRLKQTFDPAGVFMDFVLKSDGTLDETEELATAVRVALGTDALVGPEDVLPDPDSTDRRGWWGDMDAELLWSGWAIGCKNWLLTRAKITDVTDAEGDTLERARIYTMQAIKPMIDRRVASQVSVVAERVELERIDVHATIFRGPKFEIDLRYQLLWEDDVTEIIPYEPPLGILIMPPGGITMLQLTTAAPRINRVVVSVGTLTLARLTPTLAIGVPLVKSPSSASLISARPAPSISIAAGINPSPAARGLSLAPTTSTVVRTQGLQSSAQLTLTPTAPIFDNTGFAAPIFTLTINQPVIDNPPSGA